MREFQDGRGRTWQVVIDLPAIRRVRDALGLNLYGLTDEGAKPLGQLLRDAPRLVDVLYVLCQNQAKERNVSDEDFGRSFDGDVLQASADTFVEELIDFLPTKARAPLRELMAKGKLLGEMLVDRGRKELAAIDVDRFVDRMFEQAKRQAGMGGDPAGVSLLPVNVPAGGEAAK